MDFKDKFIRYHPDITFEVFELIWDKLHDLGYTDIGARTAESRFRDFKTSYCLALSKNYPTQFNAYSQIGRDKKEITVEELLGYNPFTKSTEINKWSVGSYVVFLKDIYETKAGTIDLITEKPSRYGLANLKNYSSLSIDREKKGEIKWVATLEEAKKLSETIKNTTITELLFTETDWSKATEQELLDEAKRRYPVGTKFISPQNAQEYIVHTKDSAWLGKNENEVLRDVSERHGEYVFYKNQWAEIISLPESKPIESIPEYVECIKGLGNDKHVIVNKIYKVENYDLKNKIITICGKEVHRINFKENVSNTTDYIPSTKEAFDAQNKPKDMFLKDEYIVTLSGNFRNTCCGKENYCFKQRTNCNHISPQVDLKGSNTNGNYNLTFDKAKDLKDWRYATAEEIEEYDRLGKPFDVTTLNKPNEQLGIVVHCTTQQEWDFVLSKFNPLKLCKDTWNNYKENSCIVIQSKSNNGRFCEVNFYEAHDYLIISFEDWCKQNNYTMKTINKLDERYLGKIISFQYSRAQYDNALVIKERGKIYLLNNNRSNHDGHSDKSKYKYSLVFDSWDTANMYVSKIELAGDNVEEAKFNFIIGNWYKERSGYYCKLMKENKGQTYPDRFPGLEYINTEGDYESDGTFFYIDSIIPKEIDLSEIQQYLPDGHPDKIKGFKVGDWVYFMGTDPKLTTKLWTIGLILQIEDINDNQFLATINGKKCSNRNTQFRLATQSEIDSITKPRFKNGDYVKLIANTSSSRNNVGDIGIVSDLDGDDCRVKTPKQKHRENWSGFSDLELSSKEEYDKYWDIEFVLPEKWYIEVGNEKEAVIYRDYFSKKHNFIWHYERGYLYGFDNGRYISSSVGEKITFEQFQKHVLNQSNEMKESTTMRYKTGDYIVCLRPKNLETESIKFNYCYEQKESDDKLSPIIGSDGTYGSKMYESNPEYSRLATKEESDYYKKIGRPYDVSILNGKSKPNDCPFNEGDLVICEIQGAEFEGKIHFEEIEKGKPKWIFICNNTRSGFSCKNKLGYRYSYTIWHTVGSSFEEQLRDNYVTNLKLAKESTSDDLDNEYEEIFGGINCGIRHELTKQKLATWEKTGLDLKGFDAFIDDLPVGYPMIPIQHTKREKKSISKTIKIKRI